MTNLETLKTLEMKIQIMTSEDGNIMPMCPELCPESNLSKLERYVQEYEHLRTVFIKPKYKPYNEPPSWQICVSTPEGVYEQNGWGDGIKDYENVAQKLLNGLLQNKKTIRLYDTGPVLHSKKPNFDSENEYTYWKKMIILRTKKIMISELCSDSWLSRLERHIKDGGMIHISYPTHMPDYNKYTPTMIIVSFKNVELCDASLSFKMSDLEYAFKRIYYKLCPVELIDGKTYFVKGVNSNLYRMNDMHIGKYDSTSNTIGNTPLKYYIESRDKLTQFHEFIPFVPNIEDEIHGIQIHRVWLIGESWCRRIDIEFEGIQFGYPTYKMYVNDDHVLYISYKNECFEDQHGVKLTISH